eukprot:5096092-Amphidinium_carterae.1
MQQIDRQPTPLGQPTGALYSSTHSPLNEDSPIPAVHVQRTVKGIERKSSLDGELFKSGKWHSLIAFGAVQENSCLVLAAGIPSLNPEG